MRTHGLVVLALGLLPAAEAAKEDASKKELAQLQGTWRVVAEVRDGVKSPPQRFQSVTVTYDADGKFQVEMAGKAIAQGTSTLDPSKQPKAMDIRYTEGEQKGQTLLAIYEVKGDTRRTCVAPPGRGRPTAFAAPPGSGYSVIVYQREKSKTGAGEPDAKKKAPGH
jgi:uncharacterized protein (TIGR03067 family)